MDIDYKLIGERIKESRLKKKLTQENLAEKLGISTAFLSRLERGSSQINLKRLVEVCTILDTNPGHLLTGVNQKSNSYLNREFEEILKSCPKDRLKMVYEIIKVVVNS